MYSLTIDNGPTIELEFISELTKDGTIYRNFRLRVRPPTFGDIQDVDYYLSWGADTLAFTIIQDEQKLIEEGIIK